MAEQSTSNPSSSARKGTGVRKTFKHSADNTIIVTDGYMSIEDADTVMLKTMESWGFTSSNESTRDAIVAKISQALRQGTSHERDFSRVYFEHNGNRCAMDVVKHYASMYDKSENPVRVFARSYKQGEIVVRICDMLKDPENVQLREVAALDYGATLDVAHLCFDISDALPGYPGIKLAQNERLFIKSATISKVRESRSMFVGSNDGNSAQQVSANASAGRGGPAPAVPNVAAAVRPGNADQRAGFGSMR